MPTSREAPGSPPSGEPRGASGSTIRGERDAGASREQRRRMPDAPAERRTSRRSASHASPRGAKSTAASRSASPASSASNVSVTCRRRNASERARPAHQRRRATRTAAAADATGGRDLLEELRAAGRRARRRAPRAARPRPGSGSSCSQTRSTWRAEDRDRKRVEVVEVLEHGRERDARSLGDRAGRRLRVPPLGEQLEERVRRIASRLRSPRRTPTVDDQRRIRRGL